MGKNQLLRRSIFAFAAAASVAGLPAVYAADDSSGLPAEQEAGQVRYVTGGVGLSESEAFEHSRSQYPLAVEVYGRQNGRDVFTAGSSVQITDAHGEQVLQAQTEGPFLLAKLPPGRYDVEVTTEGQTQRRQAHVTASGHAREVFVFNNLP